MAKGLRDTACWKKWNHKNDVKQPRLPKTLWPFTYESQMSDFCCNLVASWWPFPYKWPKSVDESYKQRSTDALELTGMNNIMSESVCQSKYWFCCSHYCKGQISSVNTNLITPIPRSKFYGHILSMWIHYMAQLRLPECPNCFSIP